MFVRFLVKMIDLHISMILKRSAIRKKISRGTLQNNHQNKELNQWLSISGFCKPYIKFPPFFKKREGVVYYTANYKLEFSQTIDTITKKLAGVKGVLHNAPGTL